MAIVSSPQPLRTPPPASRPSRADGSGNGQAPSDLLIASRIAEAQTALWRAELSRVLLIPVMTTMIGLVAWAVMDQWIWSPNRVVRMLVLVGGVSALVAWFVKRVLPLMSRQIQPEYAAYSLEHDLPELRHSLTSYVSLREDQQREGVRGLVVKSIGVRAAGQLQSHQIEVPSEATGNLAWWLGVAGALALAAAYALFSPKDTLQSTKRLLLPLSSIEAPTRVSIEDVLPGSIEVLAGRPFEVSARITGLSSAETAVVEYGELFNQRRTLEKNADSGRHLASISVDGASEYRMVAGDTVAGPFAITTRDVPVVAIEQVTITPPAYTKLAIRTGRGGAIVAEENAFAKVEIRTNRPVERARIEFNPRVTGDKTLATGGFLDVSMASDGTTGIVSFPAKLPAKSSGAVTLESYRVRVWDSQGNENPEPIVYPIRIVADLAPEIAIMAPTAALTEVPLNGAQKVEIHSLDPDYGLKRIDVQVRKGIDLVHTETIWSSVEGDKGGRDLVWVLQPQSLGLRVDDKIQVTAVASDNRHDAAGQPSPNVIASDSIEIKIVAPDENAPLPNFDEPSAAEEQSDGSESKKPGDEGGENGDKGQGGQGSGGGSESGEASEGESGGNSGSGSMGKQAASDQNNEGKQNGQSGGQSAKPEGDEASDSDGSPSNSAKDQSGGNSGASDDATNDDNQSPSSDPASDQPAGEQAAGDAAGNAGQPANAENNGASPGKPAGKPQHDGDAFERIRDFLNEKEQAKEGNSADSEPAQDAGQPRKDDGSGKPSGADKPSASDKKSSESKGNPGTPSDSSKKEPSNQGKPGEGTSESADSKGDEPSETQGESDTTKAKPQGGDQEPMSDQPPKGSEAADDPKGNPTPNGKPANGEKTGSQDSDAARGDDAQGNDPTTEEGKNSDAGSNGDDASDGKGNESKGNDAKGNDAKGNDAKGNDGKGNEGKGNDGKGNEGKGNEAKGNEGKGEQAAEPTDGSEPSGNATPGSDQGGAHSNERSNSAGEPGNSPGDADENKPNDGSTPTRGGEQSGEPSGEPALDAALPPDPVDVEYAKKATDLVLDYLETQKETPDPKLLENLDWTPDELRSFVDRWSRLRSDGEKPGGDQKQIEEALKSLGIRAKQSGPLGRGTDKDDALRGLRDSGNRTPPPTIHRDAFDAFRRNANRQ